MTTTTRVPLTVAAAADGQPLRLPRQSNRRSVLLLLSCLALLAVGVVVSAGVGQMPISAPEVLGSILRRLGFSTSLAPTSPFTEAALWSVRFPRVTMSVVIGAALAIGGALMQGIFGNPLAEPGVVGVSSGAAVGACLVISLGLSSLGMWTLVVAAFTGGVGATLLAYSTARRGGRTEVVTLVLTGIAINAVCGALIALFVFLGTTQSREEMVFWQLGSLNGSRWPEVAIAAPLIVLGIVAALGLARHLDLLSLGERTAGHLGVNVERLRAMTIVVVAVVTSAGVAFSGVISFVGLVVPHIVRMVLGPGHRWLIAVSAVGGAALLLFADLLARTLVTYAELPIGMLTALVGGPFFFWLIRSTSRSAGGWS